jgi:aspartokinase-like uncharacterized kinase
MNWNWQRGRIRGPEALPAVTPLVVKLGGSLLAMPDWPAAVAALLADSTRPLVVVGGGGLVDGLRAIDAASPRPAALMHLLAIEAMSLTARLVAETFGLPLVTSLEPGGGILDAAAWLEASGAGDELPAGWDVTSDSIAATAASRSGRGLLLVKRVPPPPGAGGNLESLAASGWVDEHFPTAAAGVQPIAWAARADER